MKLKLTRWSYLLVKNGYKRSHLYCLDNKVIILSEGKKGGFGSSTPCNPEWGRATYPVTERCKQQGHGLDAALWFPMVCSCVRSLWQLFFSYKSIPIGKMSAAFFPSVDAETGGQQRNSTPKESPQECGCRETTTELMASTWWRRRCCGWQRQW